MELKKNVQSIMEDIGDTQRAKCNAAGARVSVLGNHFQQMK